MKTTSQTDSFCSSYSDTGLNCQDIMNTSMKESTKE